MKYIIFIPSTLWQEHANYQKNQRLTLTTDSVGHDIKNIVYNFLEYENQILLRKLSKNGKALETKRDIMLI